MKNRAFKTIVVPVNAIESWETEENKLKIALIAHDTKKADILAFAVKNRDILEKCILIATKSTGRLINSKTQLEVKEMMSGPEGGDLQIGGLVASEENRLGDIFTGSLGQTAPCSGYYCFNESVWCSRYTPGNKFIHCGNFTKKYFENLVK